MFKFKKKSGQIVDVNESSYDAAKALGWIEVKETKAKRNGNSEKRNK